MSVKPSPITILQDTRERTRRRFSNECTVQVVTLTEGAYSLAGFSDRVRVERKSLAVFLPYDDWIQSALPKVPITK